MNPIRKQRVATIVFLLVGGFVTTGLALTALQSNIDHFYLPHRIVNGEAPIDQRIRAGGLVMPGSIVRNEEDLRVRFTITDLEGSTFDAEFEGLLPSLFEEGKGAIVIGQLKSDGVFYAQQVLAKHDENYEARETAHMKQYE